MADFANPAEEQNDTTSNDWFYVENGASTGPVSRSDLQAYLLTRSDDVSVWHPTLAGWRAASQVGFKRVPPAPSILLIPPVVPPPASSPTMSFGSIGEPFQIESQPGFWSMLFSFSGRAGRRRFFSYFVLAVTVGVAATMAALGAAHLSPTSSGALPIRVVIGLPIVWITLALASKRLHDLGFSAWHLIWVAPADYLSNFAPEGPEQIITLIPALAISLWLFLKRGEKGPNAFGPDPLGASMPMTAASAFIVAPNEHPIRNGALIGLLAIVVVGAAAYGLAGIMDATTPGCGSKEAIDNVRQIVNNDTGFAIMSWAYNGNASVEDARTLSNSEPMNGRTCQATLVVRDRKDAASTIGSQEVTYTVQSVDGQAGRYVVTLRN